MIDCEPGRVAMWQRIRRETAKEIERVVEEVFLERGPVEEVLIDNGVGFHLKVFRELYEKWGVRQYFRSEYRPSSNEIVERHHRTIKAVAEKSQISPQEAVFMMPNEASVPHLSIFTYEWQHSRSLNVLKYCHK